MFTIIKDIIKLKEHKTIERIKIIINNDPIKYSTTIALLNTIGEDYFATYLFVDDNCNVLASNDFINIKSCKQ